MMTEKKTGSRDNQEKLRWRNFPLFLVEPLIEVGHFGEKKYKTFNFLDGLGMNDTLDCMKRHLMKFESPYWPDIDEESKCNHLAHVAWNALVALHMLKARTDLDDRWKPTFIDSDTIEAAIDENLPDNIIRVEMPNGKYEYFDIETNKRVRLSAALEE